MNSLDDDNPYESPQSTSLPPLKERGMSITRACVLILIAVGIAFVLLRIWMATA